VDVDIGKRLKDLHRARGLSQRQLANRSGVNNGTISMIEQNRTSPSVGSLKKVLEGIPVTLSEFFSVDDDVKEEKYFFRKSELKELSPVNLRNDSHVSLMQVGDASKHSLQILYERYAPGADTGSEMYTHESEEGGIVISGEIEVTVDDQVQVLSAGDSYLFDSRQPHRFRNIGDRECVIVSACTPPSF
jgi:transcriptional regulator with XRE-family HTH domain